MQCKGVWIVFLAVFSIVFMMVHAIDATDLTAYVCPDGRVAVGDPVSDFSFKCRVAVQSGASTDNSGMLWVYMDTSARRVVYFKFADSRLQRIYTKPCLSTADAKNDPYCAQLQGLPIN